MTKEFIITKVVVYENGNFGAGHVPFKIIKEGNKEFWTQVLICLEGLAVEIKSYLENETKTKRNS